MGALPHLSLCAPSLPVFNFIRKEIEAKRTGRLIQTGILALELIALHEKITFEFTAG